MGGGSSKTVESKSNFGSVAAVKQSNLLLWKRCIFMTEKQYKKKFHIDDNMYHSIELVKSDNIDNYITNKIQNIANSLPNRKVPAPIYVMYAKKLEYDGTVFGECIDEAGNAVRPDGKPYGYGNIKQQQINIVVQKLGLMMKLMMANMQVAMTTAVLSGLEKDRDGVSKLKPMKVGFINITQEMIDKRLKEINDKIPTAQSNKTNAINNKNYLNDLNNSYDRILNELKERLKRFTCVNDDNYKKYEDIANRLFDDIEGLKNSEISKFSFEKNKNIEVIIYIPNLNKNGMYYTSFKDYTLHNEWMYSFIKFDQLLFNIIPTTDSSYNKLKALYLEPRIQSNSFLLRLLEMIMRIYILLQQKEFPLIKELMSSCFNQGCSCDYGEDFDNIPSFTKDSGQKKINANNNAPYYPTKCLRQPNYKDNMFDDDKDFKKKVEEYLLGDCLKNYMDALNNLGSVAPDNDVEPLLLNQLKKCSIKYRHKEIGTFNWDEGTDKFSVEYNRKILSELSQRKYSYPGIQEVIYPFFILNETHSAVSNYITYMPWGNQLITHNNALTIDSDFRIEENIPFLSLDSTYKLLITSRLNIYKNNRLYYSLTDKDFGNYINKNLRFESSGLINLYGYDTYGERLIWSMVVVDLSTAVQPVSLGFHPDTGRLIAFDNGLNIVTSKVLENRIDQSIADNMNSLYTIPEAQINLSKSFDEALSSIGINQENYDSLVDPSKNGYESMYDSISNYFSSLLNLSSSTTPDSDISSKNAVKSMLGMNTDSSSGKGYARGKGSGDGGGEDNSLLWDDDKEMKILLDKLLYIQKTHFDN